MMRPYILAVAIVACTNTSPPVGATSSVSGSGGAGGGVVLPPDAGPVCNGNGGIACVTTTDCPPATGCPYVFVCEDLPEGGKQCVTQAIDAGK